MDSWLGLSLIEYYINLYSGMKFITKRVGNSIQIAYNNVEYVLHDNGGEITISKINESGHFAEFPTVSIWGDLNSETLMYRLIKTLKNEAIDYKFIEKEFHYLFDVKKTSAKRSSKIAVDERTLDNVSWWAA